MNKAEEFERDIESVMIDDQESENRSIVEAPEADEGGSRITGSIKKQRQTGQRALSHESVEDMLARKSTLNLADLTAASGNVLNATHGSSASAIGGAVDVRS